MPQAQSPSGEALPPVGGLFEVFCDLNPSDINCRVYDD
jgi:hypothetical protein